jgi:hypothetical protein
MDCNTHARTDFYAAIYGFFVLPVAIALYIAGLTVLLMWVLKPAALFIKAKFKGRAVDPIPIPATEESPARKRLSSARRLTEGLGISISKASENIRGRFSKMGAYALSIDVRAPFAHGGDRPLVFARLSSDAFNHGVCGRLRLG